MERVRRRRIGNKDRRVEGYKGVVYYTLYDKPKRRSNGTMGQGDSGTMSFMSIDLHEDPPPVHMERFEYESLFYVLYWICLSYSDGKLLPEEKRHSAFKCWPRWNSNDHEGVRSAKAGLRDNGKIFENVDKFPAMYRPLIRPWLYLLQHTLRKGYNARNDADFAGRMAEFDDDTLGGYVSYESIHKILEN